jgi:hypothetical protein
MAQYPLKYKTFDSLLADVMVDFKTYALENLIEPQELIKVTKWVNADLGLRINKTSETILDLEHRKAKLPDDFQVFNYALLCGEGSHTHFVPQGVQTMEVPYPRALSAPALPDLCEDAKLCPTDETIPGCGGCGTCEQCVTDNVVTVPGYNPLRPYGDPCLKPRVFMDCKGDAFELIQIFHTQTTHWKHLLPLRLVNNTHEIAPGCPNIKVRCNDEISIKDGFLHSNVKCGKIYLNYEGMMEDEEGNLLVPDHDILTPFYEYKLKHRIMENLWMSGEDVERKLAYLANSVRTARIEARNVVNTPDFAELKETWLLNRRAYNERYVNMFRAYNWLNTPYPYGDSRY